MTRDNFLAKYGNRMVVFDSYYKYTFTFVDTDPTNERPLTVRFGGDSSDIYRFTVEAGKPKSIKDIEREVNLLGARIENDVDEYWGS